MNFTCINPDRCSGGVIKVFDRGYTAAGQSGSFFRCADHACSTGAPYLVDTIAGAQHEWICYDPTATT